MMLMIILKTAKNQVLASIVFGSFLFDL